MSNIFGPVSTLVPGWLLGLSSPFLITWKCSVPQISELLASFGLLIELRMVQIAKTYMATFLTPLASNFEGLKDPKIMLSRLYTYWKQNQTSFTLYSTQDFYSSWAQLRTALCHSSKYGIPAKSPPGNVFYQDQPRRWAFEQKEGIMPQFQLMKQVK